MSKLIDTPKCLLVGNVPEGSSFFIDHVFNTLCFRVYVNFKEVPYGEDIKLPPGSYGQPILASEITEEQARKLVQKVDLIVATHFKDYENKGVVKKALESFASLLRSHNLQPSTTCVIPKTI